MLGQGKKPGTTIDLTPEQRSRLDAATNEDGYLSGFEEEHRETGRDYYPFPMGRLRRGRASRYYNGKEAPMTPSGFRGRYRDLERIASVEHVSGRGWYGLRRLATDQTRRVTADERVRDEVGGWTPGSEVRERTYMDEKDASVRADAARTRRSSGDTRSPTTQHCPTTRSPTCSFD